MSAGRDGAASDARPGGPAAEPGSLITKPGGPATELDRELAALRAGISEALQRFEASVESEVYRPRRELFGTLAEAHADAWAKVVQGEEGGEGDRWERYAAYRNAVLGQVLIPLRDHLHSDNAAQDLEDAWSRLTADILRLAGSLPSEIQRPEPADFFGPGESDGPLNRIRKSVVRARRSLASVERVAGNLVRKMSGGREKAPPTFTLTVPLQRMAEGFLLGGLIQALEGLRSESHGHCAQPILEIERAIALWTREWPRVEMEAERGAGYLPGAVRTALDEAFGDLGVAETETGQPRDFGSDATGPTEAAPEPPVESDGGVPALPSPPDALAGALARGSKAAAPSEMTDRMNALAKEVWGRFSGEVAVAGSFMMSPIPPGPDRSGRASSTGEPETVGEHWIRWHRGVPNRLILSIHLMRLRDGIVQARDRLVAGVAEGVVLPLARARRESCDAYGDLAKQAEAIFAGKGKSAGAPDLAEPIEELLGRGLQVLEEAWSGCLGPDGLEQTIRDLTDEVLTSLAAVHPNLPSSVFVQDVHGPGEKATPFRGIREMPVREAARHALDVLRLEKLRKAPDAVLSAVASTREEVAGLPEIVRFNLEAAVASLKGEEDAVPNPDEASAAGQESGPTQAEAAASLTLEGLERTKESLARLLQALPEAWWTLATETDEVLTEAYLEVHGLVTAERGVEDPLMGFRARTRRWMGRSLTDVRGAWDRGERRVRKTIRRWVVRGRKAVRFGRTVVAGDVTVAGEGDRALTMIRQAPEVLAGLPLIYRRLFSFEPLTDPALLKGRETEEAWVRGRFERWQSGLGGPALLTGPVGAGHTSFFNALSATLFADTRSVRMELTERVRTEARLCALLAQAFGFEGDAAETFEDLGRVIRRQSPDGQRWIVLIERVEQVFLRTPGGTELFEGFLSFQTQTADLVFWLSSMSGAAWKLVAKTEPRAASLVRVQPLTPPTRKELEELILVRHRRSGLPLEFLPPQEVNPLLRRKLRLARNEEARQRLLGTEYFDRLFRLSQDSIPLAILYWLRSTDFRSGEGKLFLTPPSEIRYAFLDDLDLELDFALKAFLEHGSLTLDEYREVFAAEHDVGVQTFEVLRARLLLEPVGGGKGLLASADRRVDPEVGYRITPLLSEVVARRLKNRNILH